ncbi:hypothetical protein AOZ06_15280 [Kibdelosporangium phytohabitans]|uniref:Uncharacterized protein n=1 Tax=Kibdelosporangium phytohabitans TaxID=860235 RepID=A0A0N9I0B5_9PSEU|nr:hypothetical protein AOZ06_15280 [Kibdelosporangium phytohabitans]
MFRSPRSKDEPEVLRLEEALADRATAELSYTGVSINLLAMRPEIYLLLLINDPSWPREEQRIAATAG